ncbi:MAG: hypothetical protein CMJ83_01345 [Planctomycetes bacterium]|nr:hypothetical protein [Planctomycetota bacterium]
MTSLDDPTAELRGHFPRAWVLLVASWNLDLQEAWAERAAVLEFDGGLSLALSEEVAFEEINGQVQGTRESRTP